MFSFYDKVLELILGNWPLEAIVYEDAAFQKGNAIYNFNAQKGMLNMLAQALDIQFIGYSPMTVKKVFVVYISGHPIENRIQLLFKGKPNVDPE